MRFSCEKLFLGEAISICIHAVSAKSSSPVLEGLLITATDRIEMCGYNYKTGIRRTFDASVYEQGAIVLNAKILQDIVRKLPDAIVEIIADERDMVTIKCGSSVFNLVGSAPSEFPQMPEVERTRGVTLETNTLKDMIAGTVFAVSDNDSKPIHTGALFEIEESSVTVVAVDGYRLAIRKKQLEGHHGGSFKFVVPGDTLKEISRILPDGQDNTCSIYPERKNAIFEFENTVVTTRLLEGEFLNWQSAIPQDNPIALKLNKNEVVTAVERVSLIISERLKNPVRCVFEGKLLQLSCITALGRSYDEVSIPECPEKVEIGFNNRYLLDALKASMDEDVVIELKSGLSPCIFRPENGDSFLYLVLPVRLKAGE